MGKILYLNKEPDEMSKTKNAKGKMSHGGGNSRGLPLSPEMQELIQRYFHLKLLRKNKTAPRQGAA